MKGGLVLKQLIMEVKHNYKIAKDVYRMRLEGNVGDNLIPGQFINIRIDGFFLRRPISVCDWDENSVTVIYKTVGKGTQEMSCMREGTRLDVLTGLGNGYSIADSGESPLLIGGGVGVPPLFGLCKVLLSAGKTVSVILGFNTACEVFLEKEFESLGASVYVTTADGSYGTKGFATDLMKNIDYTYFYTCGPEPMLRAVEDNAKGSGEFSFEGRMGCGFGACMGCSCKTKYGNKRICKDGPVLKREEIIW